MTQAFEDYRETPLWRVVAAAMAELQATQEIAIATAPDYVIGFVCQQLVSGRVTAATALDYEP